MIDHDEATPERLVYAYGRALASQMIALDRRTSMARREQVANAETALFVHIAAVEQRAEDAERKAAVLAGDNAMLLAQADANSLMLTQVGRERDDAVERARVLEAAFGESVEEWWIEDGQVVSIRFRGTTTTIPANVLPVLTAALAMLAKEGETK